VMLAGGIVVLLAAPLLFTTAFGSKYASGLAVLPGTLTYCIWLAVAAVAQMYLWCAERARIGTLALLIGLIANVGLNLWLLPLYGLPGAVTATAISNGFTLLVILYFNRRQGMLLVLAPVALTAGPWIALATLLTLTIVAWRTSWLLNDDQRGEIALVIDKYTARLATLCGRGRTST
jgi:PST family polysaccharide transporter